MVTLRQEWNSHMFSLTVVKRPKSLQRSVFSWSTQHLCLFSCNHCLVLNQETFQFLQIIKCGSLPAGLIFLNFNSLDIIIKMNKFTFCLPLLWAVIATLINRRRLKYTPLPPPDSQNAGCLSMIELKIESAN